MSPCQSTRATQRPVDQPWVDQLSVDQPYVVLDPKLPPLIPENEPLPVPVMPPVVVVSPPLQFQVIPEHTQVTSS